MFMMSYTGTRRSAIFLTSHEQGASHAADGYARATGKVGVCFATSGPGATNLVTGIATAYMDSVPVVAITANVGTSLLGKDSFQEIDIAGVTMPITKYSVIGQGYTGAGQDHPQGVPHRPLGTSGTGCLWIVTNGCHGGHV